MRRLNDQTRRVREAIVSVFTTHGVRWWDAQTKSHPAIGFEANGQTGLLAYSGGDPRAAFNVRTQARRALVRIGVDLSKEAPTVSDEPLTPISSESISEVQPEPVGEPIEQSAPDLVVAAPIEDREQLMPMQSAEGYLVFEKNKWLIPGDPSPNYIAVRLDHEVLRNPGDVLVIPLHVRDVVWDMTYEEFQAGFIPVAKHNTHTETPAIGQAVETFVPQPEPEPAQLDGTPSTALPSARTRAIFPSPQIGKHQPQRVEGVSPQMGRVLLAMYHLRDKGGDRFSSRMIQALLSEVDAKQVSTMLTGAISRSLVARTIAEDIGFLYKLTEEGLKAAERLGTYPWDQRDLAIPSWMTQYQYQGQYG